MVGSIRRRSTPALCSSPLARREALHRRSTTAAALRAGDVELDAHRRVLTCAAEEVALTAREFALMRLLFERVGDVCTRTELLSGVWGTAFDGEPNVVDVYIGYLRKKLAEIHADRLSIATVRGIGFRLEARA